MPTNETIENTQHVIHHYEQTKATVNVKAIKNTKGYNWEVSIHNAESVEEGMKLLREAEAALKKEFGESEEE